jgi:hypothetical protein
MQHSSEARGEEKRKDGERSRTLTDVEVWYLRQSANVVGGLRLPWRNRTNGREVSAPHCENLGLGSPETWPADFTPEKDAEEQWLHCSACHMAELAKNNSEIVSSAAIHLCTAK